MARLSPTQLSTLQCGLEAPFRLVVDPFARLFVLFATALSSPRFSCFAQGRTDLMQVLQDLSVGLKHAGLVVGDGVFSTELSNNWLRFSQLGPG